MNKKDLEKQVHNLNEALAKESTEKVQNQVALTFLCAAVAKAKYTKKVYKQLKQLMFKFEDSSDLDPVLLAMDKLCIADRRANTPKED